MSIIKGKNNIVAGFGGTKRCIGEVYFSQSGLSSDNPGALPGWTGEYYENGKTLFPDLYNFVKAHSELQVTKTEYDNAITTYGECPKYVIDEEGTELTQIYAFGLDTTKYGAAYYTLTYPKENENYWLISNSADKPVTTNTSSPTGVITSIIFNDAGQVTSLFYETSDSLGTASFASSPEKPESVSVNLISVHPSLRLPKYLRSHGTVIKEKKPTNTDATWYRQWSDGWLEQGGQYRVTTGVRHLNTRLTLPIPFADTNYIIKVTPYSVYRNTTYYTYMGMPTAGARTTTTIDIGCYGVSDSDPMSGYDWSAEGVGVASVTENTLYPWITAYTSVIPASEAQAAEFTGALSGKANTDLSNVPTGYDYVIEYVVNSDGSWYRKYKSGWLEQGGKSDAVAGGATTIITLPKKYANATYNVFVQPAGAYTSSGEANNTIPTQTTTTFTIACGQIAAQTFYWETKGKGAN